MHKNEQGFTVIELLVVMGLIAILATTVLVALNPARHFAQARNTQRTSNVAAILNAVGQNIAENRGVFTCTESIPTIPTEIKSTDGYNLGPCISPTYISSLPHDPNMVGAHYTNNADYTTGYTINQDTLTGRITVAAPGAEQEAIISVSR